jgi:DNA (cytosine-5)-methyltransferase 1
VELGKALFTALLSHLRQHYPQQRTFNALSLFSGAGGLDVAADAVSLADGSRWHTRVSLEVDHDRCETLRGYFGPDHTVLHADICQTSTAHLLEQAGLDRREVHLIYGGPPCQAFSQAGKQRGTVDPRGTLIFEFLRMVEEIKPPLFLMENVPNLKGIALGKLLRDILAHMWHLGYVVDHRTLNAADHGSPQRRNRLIFLGANQALIPKVMLPEATHAAAQSQHTLFGLRPYKTVREAFEGLPVLLALAAKEDDA